jgi:hypothetical protein
MNVMIFLAAWVGASTLAATVLAVALSRQHTGRRD